ncbi:hypothetical protein B0H12DRAFT_1144517 [Mycena haematopus]|nr:hypothetical protein B0H12DRAFT_1144517 [Mycena haematopus]
MGNCMSNTGNFEPPGAAALQNYMAAYNEQTDPVKVALRQAEERARAAEKRPPSTQTQGPEMLCCFKHCLVSINPWQRTRIDLTVADLSDDTDEEGTTMGLRNAAPPRKPVLHGIQLASCKHHFCGVSHLPLLNIVFDPAQYGTVLKTASSATPGRRAEFPISCPTCQVKPGEEPVEIGDMTARLVLGDANMDEWNHARFLSTLNLIYCPHKGCDETFDVDDVAPAPSGVNHAETLVQCPRCRGSLCKSCKSVWHENLSCEQYQALPLTERAPEDVAFANLAAQEKWRRCPKCSLWSNSSHITCICKHHFCYTCGADFEHTNGKYRCTGGMGCRVWEEQNLLDRG